jgi:hypothetical protein
MAPCTGVFGLFGFSGGGAAARPPGRGLDAAGGAGAAAGARGRLIGAISAVPPATGPESASRAAPRMDTAPFTHHEILALVEPFARRGRRVDLAASDRVARLIAFRPTAPSRQAARAPDAAA